MLLKSTLAPCAVMVFVHHPKKIQVTVHRIVPQSVGMVYVTNMWNRTRPYYSVLEDFGVPYGLPIKLQEQG